MSTPEQKTCFVIRPFDSPYDERHDNIFAPAIESAGFSAHLAGGPGVINITEEIENGIRNADICFADVSEDNPNVWYEVGFAFAHYKQVAMVCNTDMRKFDALPFDVKIKKVIPYKESVDSNVQDAAQLQKKITEHVRELSKVIPLSVPPPHILDKHQVKEPSKNNPPSAPQPPTEDNASIIHDGLTRKDLKILFRIMKYNSEHGRSISSHTLKKDWHNSLEVDISIPNLINKVYITSTRIVRNGRNVTGYKSTNRALELYENNRELFDE